MFKDTENKSEVRSWIYELLSRMERSADVDGYRREEPNTDRVVIEVEFKRD